MQKSPAVFLCVFFLFYFPFALFGGSGEGRGGEGGTFAVVRQFRRAWRERDTQRPSLPSPIHSPDQKTHCSLSVSSFFFFRPLFLFLFVITTYTMVKLQSHRPQEVTFPVPVEKKKCEGSAHMDLFIPVTVVTEAQTLCDDQGNKTDPHFGPSWPMERLV